MVPSMSSESYHELSDVLSAETKDLHRAIVSLREELEAIDAYQQRAEACSDDELRVVLVHNKNEEIEHATMILEWLRRHDQTFAANIRTYLGSSGPITETEGRTMAGAGPKAEDADSNSLGLGSLRGAI